MAQRFDSFPKAAQKLILATEQLIAERGVLGTSVREILRRSGQKNNSAIYLYFGTRENLIDTAFDIRQGEVEAARQAMLARLGRLPEDTLGLLELLLMPILDAFDPYERTIFAQFLLHLLLHDPNSSMFTVERRPATTNVLMAALRTSRPELSDALLRFRVVMTTTMFLQAIVYSYTPNEAANVKVDEAFWGDLVLSLHAAMVSPARGGGATPVNI
ncbi:MAG: TetR/AcrR family transcriptional regulator [Rhizorhabdus sp.]|nr:TetR/AcrR family transcriptional regulator [Rhizorhabdus sp.]